MLKRKNRTLPLPPIALSSDNHTLSPWNCLVKMYWFIFDFSSDLMKLCSGLYTTVSFYNSTMRTMTGTGIRHMKVAILHPCTGFYSPQTLQFVPLFDDLFYKILLSITLHFYFYLLPCQTFGAVHKVVPLWRGCPCPHRKAVQGHPTPRGRPTATWTWRRRITFEWRLFFSLSLSFLQYTLTQLPPSFTSAPIAVAAHQL